MTYLMTSLIAYLRTLGPRGGIACKGSTSKDGHDPVGVGGVACGSGVCVYLGVCRCVHVRACERACRFWACVHRSDVSVRDVT